MSPEFPEHTRPWPARKRRSKAVNVQGWGGRFRHGLYFKINVCCSQSIQPLWATRRLKKKGSAEIKAGCLLFSGRPSGINRIGSRAASTAGTCDGSSFVAASFRAAGSVPETSVRCGSQQHEQLVGERKCDLRS